MVLKHIVVTTSHLVCVGVWMVFLSTVVLNQNIKYVGNYLIFKSRYLGVMVFCKNKLHVH